VGGIFKSAQNAVGRTASGGIFKGSTVKNPAKAVTGRVVNPTLGVTFGAASTTLQGAGSLLGQTTTILRENPELAGLAGGAFGVPGLGGLFGGGGAGSADYSAPNPPPGGTNWLLLGGIAIVGVVGLYLILRK
jgi:hypothetical protein